jgi:hypothetical protein
MCQQRGRSLTVQEIGAHRRTIWRFSGCAAEKYRDEICIMKVEAKIAARFAVFLGGQVRKRFIRCRNTPRLLEELLAVGTQQVSWLVWL